MSISYCRMYSPSLKYLLTYHMHRTASVPKHSAVTEQVLVNGQYHQGLTCSLDWASDPCSKARAWVRRARRRARSCRRCAECCSQDWYLADASSLQISSLMLSPLSRACSSACSPQAWQYYSTVYYSTAVRERTVSRRDPHQIRSMIGGHNTTVRGARDDSLTLVR